MNLVESDWLSSPMRDVPGDLTRVEAAVLDKPPAGSQSTADGAGKIDPRAARFERRLIVDRRARRVVLDRQIECLQERIVGSVASHGENPVVLDLHASLP